MRSPSPLVLAPYTLRRLRATRRQARATPLLSGLVALRGGISRSNLRRGRSLNLWHAVSAIVLVLVSSCGTRTRDPADSASDRAKAGASERAGVVVSARDPPAESATSSDASVSADNENDWAPNATVERVVDGDTINVTVGGRLEAVRLIGIDTPESVAPTRPVQCFGEEASLHLEALLPAGTEITLVRDTEARDAYHRLLAYVVRSHDGLFVNLELVAAGYAAVLNYPPNDYYASVLARAEANAVAAGRGLWGECGGPDVPLG